MERRPKIYGGGQNVWQLNWTNKRSRFRLRKITKWRSQCCTMSSHSHIQFPLCRKRGELWRVSEWGEYHATRNQIRGIRSRSMQGTAARTAALATLLAAVLSLHITKTNADGNFLTTKGRKLTGLYYLSQFEGRSPWDHADGMRHLPWPTVNLVILRNSSFTLHKGHKEEILSMKHESRLSVFYVTDNIAEIVTQILQWFLPNNKQLESGKMGYFKPKLWTYLCDGGWTFVSVTAFGAKTKCHARGATHCHYPGAKFHIAQKVSRFPKNALK